MGGLLRPTCLNSSDTTDWYEAAAIGLYSDPDLSRCSLKMLQAFLDSVKSSKRRRRLVKTLDLLSSPQKKVTLSTVFDTYDVCQIPLGQEFRYNDTVFTELFAMFKNLEVIRIYGGPLLTDGIKAHWKSLSYTVNLGIRLPECTSVY